MVDDVPQPEDAVRPQHGPDPAQRHRLPEVGQVVKGVAGVDDVGWVLRVVVGEEPGIGDLDVLDVGFVALEAQPLAHQR